MEEKRQSETRASEAEVENTGPVDGESTYGVEGAGSVSAEELEAAERAIPPEMVNHIHRLLDQQQRGLREEFVQRMEDTEQGLKN